MSYRVQLTKTALKQLNKLDRQTAALILGWVRKNLEGCENPRLHGTGLSGNLKGIWRYRVGDYRLIADIPEGQLLILMLETGHRSQVY
ncbi:MAG: type II toxin-antitoxin system RelE/ParE family toxin [Clostridiales bacterium]|nr:type II toxin-antitoxin system RelE/ParE family toxin [Clostridiales bacterium]